MSPAHEISDRNPVEFQRTKLACSWANLSLSFNEMLCSKPSSGTQQLLVCSCCQLCKNYINQLYNAFILQSEKVVPLIPLKRSSLVMIAM